MTRDADRIERNRRALHDQGLDAIACTLPSNVLLTSGYWPVVGMSIALVTPQKVVLVVPKDEASIASDGWADEVKTFEPASLDRIIRLPQAIEPVLQDAIRSLNLTRARIGIETGGFTQPASYAAMYVFGSGLAALLSQAAPEANLEPADKLLHELRMKKTAEELACIREVLNSGPAPVGTSVVDSAAGQYTAMTITAKTKTRNV